MTRLPAKTHRSNRATGEPLAFCSLCGCLVEAYRLQQVEVQGLRGHWICDAHRFEAEARERQSFQDLGGAGQSVGLHPGQEEINPGAKGWWPGAKPPKKERVRVIAQQANAVEDGSITGLFRIEREQPRKTALVVTYTVAGTATPGDDYKTLPGTVIIPPEWDHAVIPVVALEDQIIEDDESVILTISASPLYDILSGAESATVWIRNTTVVVPTVGIALSKSKPPGTLGAFEVYFQDGQPIDFPLTVYYSVGGTAIPGDLYEPLPGSVGIPAGDIGVLIPVLPGNSVPFVEVTVILSLSPHGSYKTDPLAESAGLVINPAPPPPVTPEVCCTFPVPSHPLGMAHPGDTIAFEIVADGPAATDIDVAFLVELLDIPLNGDGDTPEDYLTILDVSPVTIPAGDDSAEVRVSYHTAFRPSRSWEPAPAVRLTLLLPGAGYTLVEPIVVTVFVVNW